MKKFIILSILFINSIFINNIFATIDDKIVFQVQSGGSDTNNGGGFSPNATFATDLTATSGNTASPIVSSATYNFVAGDVNNYIFIQAGTNWVKGYYKIVSVASNAATLDAAIGHVILWSASGTTNGPVNTVVGIATVASPTSGTWGVDYSRSNSPFISFTDMVIGVTTTQFTSVANPAGPNWIGNIISVTSGTGFTVKRVQVTAFTLSGFIATCDSSLGTTASTGGHGGLGGAIATPGLAMSFTGTINKVHAYVLGSATYTLSSSNNVAGGKVTLNNGGVIIGYSTNRYPYNLDANRPVFQSNSNTYSLVTSGGGTLSLHCIDFENGNSNTSITGYDDSSNNTQDVVWNCKFNAIAIGVRFGNTSVVDNCYISNCTNGSSCITGSDANNMVINSIFVGNTAISYSATINYGNIYYNNGWTASGMIAGRIVDRCLLHSNSGSSGLGITAVHGTTTNTIFWNNTGSGSFAYNGTNDSIQSVNNCAFGSNTNDVSISGAALDSRITRSIILTADPCVSASTGNFALSTTAGGGPLLKLLGYPVNLSNGTTSQGLDVGPVQSISSGGGFIPGPMMMSTKPTIKLPIVTNPARLKKAG